MSDNLSSHFLLREDVTFLNHGSFGACPRPVFEAYQAWQLELEREPVEFLGRKLTEHMRLPAKSSRQSWAPRPKISSASPMRRPASISSPNRWP